MSAANRPGPQYVEHEVRAPATELARRWAGWSTALKPAWEPVIVAQKPLDGTYIQNLAEHGVGALNIDASRIPWGDETPSQEEWNRMGSAGRPGRGGRIVQLSAAASERYAEGKVPVPPGRWPPNVILDEEAAAMLGGPSRFFYVPKANARDRTPVGGPRRTTSYSFNSRVCNVCGSRGKAPGPNAGGQPWPTCGHEDWRWEAPLPDGVREEGVNTHPTVKPVELMRYLVRLVTPPGGIVLDPFAGSGTTGQAALAEGMRCVLIEKEAEYVEGIRRWRGAMQIGLGL
jgi:site-specific DNA-methyltransferase (adenine-specific)